MHRESSAIHLPRPVSRLSYSQPTLSGVYHNRGTACEYLSCNVVPVELCVRKRWFTVGVWWDWGAKNSYSYSYTGTVTKCSSQIIPMDQSTARFLRDTQKKSSVTTVPGHAYAYHWCEQALIDNCLKSLTKWEQWRENNMSVEQGHTQDWQQTRVISPWIKVSEKENKKGRNASSALLFPLNYLLFTEGDEGFVLKKGKKEQTLVDS